MYENSYVDYAQGNKVPVAEGDENVSYNPEKTKLYRNGREANEEYTNVYGIPKGSEVKNYVVNFSDAGEIVNDNVVACYCGFNQDQIFKPLILNRLC